MKKQSLFQQSIALFLGTLILLSSCTSYTMIKSDPDQAKLYLNEELVGTTPYRYSDTKIVGSSTSVRIEKEGYETFDTSFSRNEEVDAGAIVGGIFVLFPFLWTMKYKPVHSYELTPLGFKAPSVVAPVQNATTSSKAEQLRELKILLDEKIITSEEFEKEKAKILEGGK